MARVQSFRVEGLAGRSEVVSAELNDAVNVCFGFNGSGKTSLLRILHSALSNNTEILKHVPFVKAEVVVYSYSRKTNCVYVLDRDRPDEAATAPPRPIPRSLYSPSRTRPRSKPKWETNPADVGAWHHRYLPTTRLYTVPTASNAIYGYTVQPEEPEEQLEASFAESLTSTWRDYSAELAQNTKEAQEAGLARILKSVISRSGSHSDDSSSDPHNAYLAVAQFLVRRGMEDDSLGEKEFLSRYQSDDQLRNVSRHIEAIESKIAELNEPREMFRKVVNELFMQGKSMKFDEKTIEVAAGKTPIALSTLSSGEKHLLRIMVETIAVGGSPMLVDEPELSLHVDWQRRLISTMRILNPSAQMIFATHSPEIMADLTDSQIIRI
jgi:energy-coupling factor transporter ATP-binding protein EcfA2